MTLVLFGLPLFIGLGVADAENDESIYSFAVEEMLANGDWLTPRAIPDSTLPFLEKPPLKFWMVAAPIRLGLLPGDLFGLRFWDALFGAAAMVYVFLIGRRLAGPLAGVTSALFLFAHRQLVFEHGLRTNNMEAALLLCYCGGMYHFMTWRDAPDEPRARRRAVAAALCFVLGFMTKFVAALFLPAVWAVVLLATAGGREMLRTTWRSWLPAIGLGLALTLPWFIYQSVHLGPQLVDTMVMTHVVRRFSASVDPQHLGPWHFYLTSLTAALRESGAVLPTVAGLVLLAVGTVRRRGTDDGAAVLVWFGLPFVLMSLGPSKLYHYAYPVLPPLALAGGVAIGALPGVVRSALVWVFGSDAGRRDPLTVAQGAIVAAVVLSVLPVHAYALNVSRVTNNPHPVRSVRDCLRDVIASRNGGTAQPGVWVEGRPSGWIYFYNFRRLGPWQQRDEPSDATVALNVFVPESWRPVLISNARFDELMSRLRSGDAALLDHLARRAGVTSAALGERIARADVGIITFGGERLLLPGPYRACALDRLEVTQRVR